MSFPHFLDSAPLNKWVVLYNRTQCNRAWQPSFGLLSADSTAPASVHTDATATAVSTARAATTNAKKAKKITPLTFAATTEACEQAKHEENTIKEKQPQENDEDEKRT